MAFLILYDTHSQAMFDVVLCTWSHESHTHMADTRFPLLKLELRLLL